MTSPPPQLTAQARATQATRALIFALLAIAFALAPHSSAQQTLGAINGEVADETGALIPNVENPVEGDAIFFTHVNPDGEMKQIVTSRVEKVDRPAKTIVALYPRASAPGPR